MRREVARHCIWVALNLTLAARPGPGCVPAERARGGVYANAALAIPAPLAPEVVVQGELAGAELGVLLAGISTLIVQRVPGLSRGYSKGEGKDGARDLHGG